MSISQMQQMCRASSLTLLQNYIQAAEQQERAQAAVAQASAARAGPIYCEVSRTHMRRSHGCEQNHSIQPQEWPPD